MNVLLFLLITFGSILITLSCVGEQNNHVITEITAESSIDQVVTKISLERTSCYGSCPVYKVTIFNDGTVRYNNILRLETTKIDPNEFQRLVGKAQEISFFDLKDGYSLKEGPPGSAFLVSDLPTRITIVHRGEEAKKVINYFGGPKELTEFENLIDQVAGTRK